MNLSIKKINLKTPIRHYVTQFFVPKHEAVKQEDIEKLQEFLHDKPRILVVTGKRNFKKLLKEVLKLKKLFIKIKGSNP